jgi:hypothetical protein
MQSVYSISELQRPMFKVITLVFLEKVTFLSSASSIIRLAVHKFCTELISDCKWWQLSIEAIQRKSFKPAKRIKHQYWWCFLIKILSVIFHVSKHILSEVLTLAQHHKIISSSFCIWLLTMHMVPITVAMWSKAWTVFSRLNTGIVGSNPIQSMDVCLHLFCVCVGSGLATG